MPDSIQRTTLWRAAFLRVENRIAAETVRAFSAALAPIYDALQPVVPETPLTYRVNLDPTIDTSIDAAALAAVATYEAEARDMVQDGYEMLTQAMRKPLHLDEFLGVIQEAVPATGVAPVKGSGLYASAAPAAGSYGMQAQMGFGLPRGVAQEVIDRPMHGMMYTERIGSLSARARHTAKQSIASGLVSGHGAKRIARDLNKRLDRPRWELERLVRSESQHALVGVQDAFAEQFDDVIAGWTYIATLDTRTCPDCGALDGRYYSKGRRRPEIPLHPNCRCTYAPEPVPLSQVVPGAKDVPEPEGVRHALRPGREGKTKRWEDVPSTMTFEDWLKDQPLESQRVVLGSVARAQLFRKGVLDVRKAGMAKASAIKREFAKSFDIEAKAVAAKAGVAKKEAAPP